MIMKVLYNINYIFSTFLINFKSVVGKVIGIYKKLNFQKVA